MAEGGAAVETPTLPGVLRPSLRFSPPRESAGVSERDSPVCATAQVPSKHGQRTLPGIPAQLRTPRHTIVRFLPVPRRIGGCRLTNRMPPAAAVSWVHSSRSWADCSFRRTLCPSGWPRPAFALLRSAHFPKNPLWPAFDPNPPPARRSPAFSPLRELGVWVEPWIFLVPRTSRRPQGNLVPPDRGRSSTR